MKKKNWSGDEIKSVLKSRLKTQRRIFEFDNNNVLVLPFLEHADIDLAVNSVKFFYNVKEEFCTINSIEKLYVVDDKVYLKLKTGENYNLYYRKMNGFLEEVKLETFKLAMLSIDHLPSIYVVLFTHYLKKTETFIKLSDFCNRLPEQTLDTTTIKRKGFKEEVEDTLNNASDKDSIIEAYKNVFKDISLEITISDNNNANLSKASLEYYKRNIAYTKSFASSETLGCLHRQHGVVR